MGFLRIKNPMPLPLVAIVGRPNVGKSSLLNALARRRVSIVEPTPGVTRDRVSVRLAHAGRTFELMDTGGIGMEDGTPLAAAVARQIEAAIAAADVILFALDVRDGVTALDLRVAARLRAAGRPVLVVANKVDTAAFEPAAAEFHRLGFGDPAPVSALQREGLADLLDRLVERLPAAADAPPPDPVLRLAVVGRRNVGKSTLVNALAREERVIVSEIPGTTRDAVDVRFERRGRAFVVIDTAGLRKKGKVEDAIELFGRMRTERALLRADVALFLLDVREPVTEVDKKLAQAIEAAGKPCVIALNKWDAAEKAKGPEAYLDYVRRALPGLAWAPVTVMAAKTGFRVWPAVELAESLHAQAGTTVATAALNRIVRAAAEWAHPRVTRGRIPKIYYATQAGVRPLRFVLFVNDPRCFTPDYRRFLAGKFREMLSCPEVPIRLELRGKGERRKSASKSQLQNPKSQ
jgi:GTP-binding protein